MDDLFADVEQLLELQPQNPSSTKAETSIQPKSLAYSLSGKNTSQPQGKLQWVEISIDQPPAQILQQLEQLEHNPQTYTETYTETYRERLSKEAIAPEIETIVEIHPTNVYIVPTSSSLTLSKLDLSSLTIPEPLPQVEVWIPPTPPQTNNWLTQLLWLLLGMSIGIAALSWLYQNKLIQIARPTSDPSPGQQEAQIFAQKTRMEIATLNIKATQTPTPASAQPNPPTPSTVLPVQPIYVPVYQPPVIPQPVAPIETPTPRPAPIAKLNPEPAPPKLTQPTKPIVPLGSNSNSKFKLVGILAFGEQSAAMVEINGAFQTIKMNNPIGDSGWILTGLNQQEAILQRNGETRSVTVGQKF